LTKKDLEVDAAAANAENDKEIKAIISNDGSNGAPPLDIPDDTDTTPPASSTTPPTTPPGGTPSGGGG